jgi:hypothetical protein
MVVGVSFCKIKVDSNFLLVLKIKCTKFHQDRSKTVDLHTKYTNRHSVVYIYIYRFILKTNVNSDNDKFEGSSKTIFKNRQIIQYKNYLRFSHHYQFVITHKN